MQTAIKSVPTFTEKDVAEQQYKNVCMQSSCLRVNGNFVCESAFNARKANMVRKKTGNDDLLKNRTIQQQLNVEYEFNAAVLKNKTFI